MTLSTQSSRIAYNGDGAQTVFDITFPFIDAAHIAAVLRAADGAETPWVENTHYNVSGGAGGTGVLTASVPPAPGEMLAIRRVVPLVQETDYPEGGAFPAASHELALDYARMVDQQQQETIDRALKLPKADPIAAVELAGVGARAGRLLGFKSDGSLDYVSGLDQSANAVTASGSTTPRTLAERFADVINVRDYGAKGDGVTDDTAAIQAALTAAAGCPEGAIVSLPPGRFRVLSTLDVSDRTVVRGAGMGLTVFVHGSDGFRVFNELEIGGVSPKREYIELRDFTIEGRWNVNQTQGGDDDRHVVLRNYDSIALIRVESLFCRQMALTGVANETLLIEGCRVLYGARDGINFTGGKALTRIINNEIRHCHDDAIALHVTAADGNPPREGTIVTGNHVEDALGIKLLGLRKGVVAHNVIRRAKGYGIHVAADSGSSEGLSDHLAIDISNNSITDVFNASMVGAGNVEAAIFLGGIEISTGGGITAVPPGDFDLAANAWVVPSEWWLNSNAAEGAAPHAGGWFVNVSNNICAQTLPDVAAYSAYGLGAAESQGRQFRDTGWQDPAVAGHIRSGHGMFIEGSYDQLQIAGNLFYGWENGIRYQFPDRIRRHFIERNRLVRLKNFALSHTQDVRDEDMQIWIRDNYVDLDPLFESDGRTQPLDGSWAVAFPYKAFDLVNFTGAVVTGNVLKNAVGLIHTNGNTIATVTENWIVGQFVGDNDANNKGVFATEERGSQQYLFVDSDPNSATYNRALGYPEFEHPAQPTSGYYAKGHFVTNRNTAVDGNGNILRGWVRLTWGNAHVAGVDWETIYWKTNTP